MSDRVGSRLRWVRTVLVAPLTVLFFVYGVVLVVVSCSR